MAAKAGQVVSGFTKVEAAIAAGQAAGPDPCQLTARRTESANWTPWSGKPPANDGEAREFPILNVLTSAQLDLALGRSNVIHAALLAGPAGNTFLSRCQILVQYRLADDGIAGGMTAKN